MKLFVFRRKKKQSQDQLFKKNLIKILGFKVCNVQLYKEALRHSSAKKIKKGVYYNNERLEFVGDSVLSTIVSDILFKKFPEAKEGELSVFRSMLISRKSLNNIANNMMLNKIITHQNNIPYIAMKNIGGNTFEALIGAIYYDKGYKFCTKFVSKIINLYFDLDHIKEQNTDYKTKLLQLAQKSKAVIFVETFENIECCEKNQHFLSEIVWNQQFLSQGKGWTKKEAEQSAAKKGLQSLENILIVKL